MDGILEDDEISYLLSELSVPWKLAPEGTAISRQFKTRSFNTSLQLVNLVAAVSEKENHHPDIHFGWGYCLISFSTHSCKGLTRLDFRLAEEVNIAVQSLSLL